MSSRRTFLAATGAVTASPPPVAALATPGNTYDFAAIDAALGRAARHRQVFAVARVADGVAFALMTHGIDAYEVARGEGRGSLYAAAVFYARGVILGVGDAMWRRYRLAEHARRRGDELAVEGTTGHPFADRIASLEKRGASFFVCDNALRDWATYLVTTAGFSADSPESVHAEFRRNLVAGALLVPAGVAALNDAQERRFTFVQASP
jgi:intracellular sulfur oxidation DsrE/DsrF family protein